MLRGTDMLLEIVVLPNILRVTISPVPTSYKLMEMYVLSMKKSQRQVCMLEHVIIGVSTFKSEFPELI